MPTPFDTPIPLDPNYQALAEQNVAWTEMQAWIEHWLEDRRCGLAPTEGSLARASAHIDRQRRRVRAEIDALLHNEERVAA